MIAYFCARMFLANLIRTKIIMSENLVIEAIKTRRSIRRFKNTPVPQELIDQVISCGTYAASGRGLQPWKIVQVTDSFVQARIRKVNAELMETTTDPFYGAPVYLIVLADKTSANYIYDGTLVMGNMMLAAHALGLGTCWINRARQEFEMSEWKSWLRSIGIEGEFEGIAHLALGYPDGEIPKPRPRKPCVYKV